MNKNEVLMKQVSIIQNILNPSTIKETCPVLLIGKAVSIFKRMYKGVIQELRSADDVREFVAEYTGIFSSQPVVISDLSNLTENATFLLLKLVEEAKFPAIVLSSQDSVNGIILSRIKRIIKFPDDSNTNNSLLSIAEASELLESNESFKNNKIKFYAENCPQLYEIESETPFTKRRKDFISIIGDTYDYKCKY